MSEFRTRKSRAKDGSGDPKPSSWCKGCDSKAAAAYQAKKRQTPEGAVHLRALVYKSRTPEDREAYRKRKAEEAGREYRRQADLMAEAQAKRDARRQQLADARAARQAAKDAAPPKETNAEQFRRRYREDPEFALKERVRAALRRKRQGHKLGDLIRGAVIRNGKSGKAESFLGYTMAHLRAHLEAQFTTGMNWDEFCAGRIHIDHIRPLASFDLSDINELKRAWQMDNLQPLWAEDNLRKGAKWAA